MNRFNIDLDPQLTRWASRQEPGCAIGLIEDGRLVFTAEYGVEDLTERHPITSESRFDIASEAKQFTAAYIALIEQEGRVTTGNEIGQILPELPEEFRRISIEQLLHHTSGIPDFFPVPRERDLLNRPCVLQTVYEIICEMPSTGFPPGERLEVAEALYESLEGPPDPGADAAWSVEIERRLKQIDSGQAKFSPWDEARRRINWEGNGKTPG